MSGIELATKGYADSKGSGSYRLLARRYQSCLTTTIFTRLMILGGVIRFKKEMTQLEAANYMNCEYILPRSVDWGRPVPMCLYGPLIGYCNVCYAWPKDMPFPGSN